MRTDLSHLPGNKQLELERVVAMLHEEFDEAMKSATSDKKKRGRIEKIVLFGSYAREDWVEDHVGWYFSDYDLLVVVNEEKLAAIDALWIERARDRFLREYMMRLDDGLPRPAVNFIVHTLHDVNEQLGYGRYFFCDIAKEGIALYELKGSKPFAKPGQLTPEAALAEANGNFEEWYEGAASFLRGYTHALSDGDFKKSAFDLHQAAEQLYHCIMLVFTNYTPQTHNIKDLRSQCERLDTRLIEVWPRATRKDRAAFNKLKEAYVKARYSKKWSISSEELQWLGERVTHLQEVTRLVCEARIGVMGDG